jgi:hypothetical protein
MQKLGQPTRIPSLLRQSIALLGMGSRKGFNPGGCLIKPLVAAVADFKDDL